MAVQQLVPSKDALRALHQLAHGPPSLFTSVRYDNRWCPDVCGQHQQSRSIHCVSNRPSKHHDRHRCANLRSLRPPAVCLRRLSTAAVVEALDSVVEPFATQLTAKSKHTRKSSKHNQRQRRSAIVEDSASVLEAFGTRHTAPADGSLEGVVQSFGTQISADIEHAPDASTYTYQRSTAAASKISESDVEPFRTRDSTAEDKASEYHTGHFDTPTTAPPPSKSQTFTLVGHHDFEANAYNTLLNTESEYFDPTFDAADEKKFVDLGEKHGLLTNLNFRKRLTPAKISDSRCQADWAIFWNGSMKVNSSAAEELLYNKLMSYAATGLQQDWHTAQNLYYVASWHLAKHILRNVRTSIIDHMLQQNPPRYEAVALLFSGHTSEISHMPYWHCEQYLTHICQTHRDFDVQLAEIEKVLEAMSLHFVPMNTGILQNVVRHAADSGRTARVHAKMMEWTEHYNMVPGMRPLHELIAGYSWRFDWSAIDKLFKWLHDEGYSRSTPLQFADFVLHACKIYSRFNSESRLYDFVSHYLKEGGLVPSNSLSSFIYTKFLRARRFDLMQKWTTDLQSSFPENPRPTRTALAAYNIARVWASTDMSCLDILDTCRALAHGELRDPFCDDFRNLTKEAVTSALVPRCRYFAQRVNYNTTNWDVTAFTSVEALFEAVRQMISFVRDQKRVINRSLQISELTRHLGAARDAVLLTTNITEYMRRHGYNAVGYDKKPSDITDWSSLVNMGERLKIFRKWTSLKTPAEVQDEIENMHSDRRAFGLELNDYALIQALDVLMDTRRRRHIAELLHDMYAKYRDTNVFSDEVFTIWLLAAWNLRNLKYLSQGLWALLELPPTRKIHAKTLVLVRLLHERVLRVWETSGTYVRKPDLNQIEYLHVRLVRRRWQESGCPDIQPDEPTFPQVKIHYRIGPRENSWSPHSDTRFVPTSLAVAVNTGLLAQPAVVAKPEPTVSTTADKIKPADEDDGDA